MADITISQLTTGKPSNSAVMPYSEGGVTKASTVSNFGVPVGAVFHLATSTVPVGYLKCNGNTVPNGTGTVQGVTADFSSLYTVLGTTYGVAGTLPDLRGQFIRGYDDGRNIDSQPTRLFGSYQTDTIQALTGTIYCEARFGGADGVFQTFSSGDGGFNGPGINPTNFTFDASRVARTSVETRPKNVALMAVIK